MSQSRKSGGASTIRRRASRPLLAVSTSAPADRKVALSTAIAMRSSSTTRTRRPARDGLGEARLPVTGHNLDHSGRPPDRAHRAREPDRRAMVVQSLGRSISLLLAFGLDYALAGLHTS